MDENELNERIAIHLGWGKINGKWIAPKWKREHPINYCYHPFLPNYIESLRNLGNKNPEEMWMKWIEMRERKKETIKIC